jgi:SAM-dependent methyltransferase
MSQHEQQLYEQVWTHDAYRKQSPGERSIPDFLNKMPVKKYDMILDVGSGCGRAGQKLVDLGYDAEGIDFASNAKDPDLDIYVHQGDITSPECVTPKTDWVYCCDVMEHIPEEELEAALTWIDRVMGLGGYFQIAMFADTLGLVEEPLHKNVKDGAYWVNIFTKKFGKNYLIHTEEEAGRRIVITCIDENLGPQLSGRL